MPKTLEGYVGDDRGQPFNAIAAVVTRVSDGVVMDAGASGPDGRWVFAGLDETDEHFVTLTDEAGRAAVRGPWSGELREAWVRDRLNVAGKPLVLDPAAGNKLTWGASGLFAAGTDLAETDARYVNIAGDTMTGNLFTDGAITVNGPFIRQNYDADEYFYTDGSSLGLFGPDGSVEMNSQDGGYITFGGNNAGLYYYETPTRRLYFDTPVEISGKLIGPSPNAGNSLTWNTNGFFVPDFLTQAEGDARYAELTDVDPFPQYLTPAEASATYLTPAAADALFLTQAEGDARYPLAAHTHDAAYVNVGGDTMTGALTLTGGAPNPALSGTLRLPNSTLGIIAWRNAANTGDYTLFVDAANKLVSDAAMKIESKLLAISPDAANIIEWRANGFYAAAGAVSDIWVNTTGDTMTGDLNMAANVLPTVTNVRSLGSTSLRWLKVWATDADFTNAPTVGGSALLTATAADALFLTPAEGNAAYSLAAHNHDAAYVNTTGDTMAGHLIFGAGYKAVFNDEVRDDKVTLYSGFTIGVRSSTLGYFTPAGAAHRFFVNNVDTLSVASGTTTIANQVLVTGPGSPAAALTIHPSSGTRGLLIRGGDPASDNTQLFFRGYGSNADLWLLGTQVSTGGLGRNFEFYDLVAAALRVRIDANGRFAVNPLTDPALPAPFNANPGLLVQHEGAHANGLSLARAASDVSPERLMFWRSRGTWASKVAIANGDVLGSMDSWAWSGANWLPTSLVRTVVNGTVTTTAVPTQLEFYTADSAGTLGVRIIIGPAGLVGVGAKANGTAAAQLDIEPTTATTPALVVRAHASHADALMNFQVRNRVDNVVFGVRALAWTCDLFGAITTVSGPTKALQIYNSAGVFQGWLPIYTTVT